MFLSPQVHACIRHGRQQMVKHFGEISACKNPATEEFQPSATRACSMISRLPRTRCPYRSACSLGSATELPILQYRPACNAASAGLTPASSRRVITAHIAYRCLPMFCIRQFARHDEGQYMLLRLQSCETDCFQTPWRDTCKPFMPRGVWRCTVARKGHLPRLRFKQGFCLLLDVLVLSKTNFPDLESRFQTANTLSRRRKDRQRAGPASAYTRFSPRILLHKPQAKDSLGWVGPGLWKAGSHMGQDSRRRSRQQRCGDMPRLHHFV